MSDSSILWPAMAIGAVIALGVCSMLPTPPLTAKEYRWAEIVCEVNDGVKMVSPSRGAPHSVKATCNNGAKFDLDDWPEND